VGLCPDVHDLVLSKAHAGRDKDVAYVRAAIKASLVDNDTLSERLALMPIGDDEGRRVERLIGDLLPPGRAQPTSFPSTRSAGAVWVKAHRRGRHAVRGYWRR
jgi:hypothetical protein